MPSALWSVDLGDGTSFVATGRIAPEPYLYGHFTSESELKGWVFERFREAVAAKRPETERLRTMELYYSGFHYLDPQMNRENKVTNLCFSTVETVWPVMTEQKPRPEIQVRQQYQQGDVQDLQDYATWLMDTAEWDLNHQLGTREKLKNGWNVHLVVGDPQTGIHRPKQWSVFDFYKDPFARHEDELEYFFLAAPAPTGRLQEIFFDAVDENGKSVICSDNIASPGYDVLERPYFDAYSAGGVYSSLESVVAGSAYSGDGYSRGGVSYGAETAPTTTAPLVSPEAGSMQWNGTTFLIQMFVRDRSKHWVYYTGDIAVPVQSTDPATGAVTTTFKYHPSALPYRILEPCSPSGWRVIQLDAAGTFVRTNPLDSCFLGIPIEIGRDYHQSGRFYAPGEQDHIIPINRSLNKRYNLLNRSLEFEALPILIADGDTGIDIDQRPVEPADVLKKTRGSEIKWLEVGGVGSHQFAMVDYERRDMDTVSGVQDVQAGRRPEGIEAAAAIRNLQDAAQTRIRGKEGPAFTEYSRLLKKCMVATGRKAKQPIAFRAANGIARTIKPETLLLEYDIRFAQGTGTVVSKQIKEEKELGLFDRGLLDQQTTLERLGETNIQTIMDRKAAENAVLAEQQAAAAAKAGGPPVGKAA